MSISVGRRLKSFSVGIKDIWISLAFLLSSSRSFVSLNKLTLLIPAATKAEIASRNLLSLKENGFLLSLLLTLITPVTSLPIPVISGTDSRDFVW